MLPDSLATRETVFCASEFESQPNWLSVRLSTFFYVLGANRTRSVP